MYGEYAIKPLTFVFLVLLASLCKKATAGKIEKLLRQISCAILLKIKRWGSLDVRKYAFGVPTFIFLVLLASLCKNGVGENC